MRNRYSRCLCLILVVFAFVSGLGFEKIATELPSSGYKMTEKELILSHQKSAFGTLMYAAELSGTSDDSVKDKIENHISSKKHDDKDVHDAFCSQSILHLGENFYVVSKRAVSLEHCEETIVTQYIHALDGKKRV